MIKVLSFLSNENCFAGHSRGPCGSHVARGPRFEHHCSMGWVIAYRAVTEQTYKSVELIIREGSV